MRYLHTHPYWAVLAIPFTPITPNADFRDLKKNVLRAIKWPFLSNPRQARLQGSDTAVKSTLFQNTAAKENRLYCMLGGHKLLARSGLVGINQLCSLKLPQSPCSQGNGGGKGKNSLRVCGHEKISVLEKWLKLTERSQSGCKPWVNAVPTAQAGVCFTYCLGWSGGECERRLHQRGLHRASCNHRVGCSPNRIEHGTAAVTFHRGAVRWWPPSCEG